MMEQDAAGYVTLADGVVARRVPTGNLRIRGQRESNAPKAEWVSDNLGFGEHSLAEMEEDRVRHGFRSIEFVRDPDCPEFIQVKGSSKAERERYIRHRGLFDKSGRRSGVTITQKDIDDAVRVTLRHICGPQKPAKKGGKRAQPTH